MLRGAPMLKRLWPASLYSRLVWILVVGMFGGQLFTSTIWFETTDSRVLDIPARLFASRLADTMLLLQNQTSDEQRHIVDRLNGPHYRFSWIPTPTAASRTTGQSVSHRALSELIASILEHRLGHPAAMHLVVAQLRDDAGKRSGILGLFNSHVPSGDFEIQLQLEDGKWLDVVANEGQAGVQISPETLALDYLVRIYLIRLLAVFLLALLAVRLVVRPLLQMGQAADALGRNIHRPPLPLKGPSEVRLAAASFNAMQQRLIAAIGERTRFLTAVSHDLRSPLTRLRLRVEMLPDPDWRDRLRADLCDMEAMVNTTLDAVQGMEITETHHNIDIDSMLESLAEDQREAGHPAFVIGPATRPIPGYPRNLKRCLQNLLDNAARYGSETTIRVADDARQLTIIISDNGPGLADPAMLERVFEPYFRLGDGAANRADGTGLGLTIARGIAAAHGGTLVLRNRSSSHREVSLAVQSVEAEEARARKTATAGEPLTKSPSISDADKGAKPEGLEAILVLPRES